jgi:hypothetical protein
LLRWLLFDFGISISQSSLLSMASWVAAAVSEMAVATVVAAATLFFFFLLAVEVGDGGATKTESAPREVVDPPVVRLL